MKQLLHDCGIFSMALIFCTLVGAIWINWFQTPLLVQNESITSFFNSDNFNYWKEDYESLQLNFQNKFIVHKNERKKLQKQFKELLKDNDKNCRNSWNLWNNFFTNYCNDIVRKIKNNFKASDLLSKSLNRKCDAFTSDCKHLINMWFMKMDLKSKTKLE